MVYINFKCNSPIQYNLSNDISFKWCNYRTAFDQNPLIYRGPSRFFSVSVIYHAIVNLMIFLESLKHRWNSSSFFSFFWEKNKTTKQNSEKNDIRFKNPVISGMTTNMIDMSHLKKKKKKKKFIWIIIACSGGHGGHSHVLVDIKCLSIDPLFFTPTLHPMTPFFHSFHTQWPPFFHFCIKFYIKIANFCALRAHFEKFNDFVAILTENLQIMPWNYTFAHWITPISKKAPIFLVPTPNDPLFLTKFYTERPLFSFSGRHLYVTFIFECPPGACYDNAVRPTWDNLCPTDEDKSPVQTYKLLTYHLQVGL